MADYLNRILVLVTSPEFLVGTLLIGLLLSIVANGLYDGVKRLLGRYSAKQKARNELLNKYVQHEAEKCVANPSYLAICVGQVNYWTTAAVIYYVLTTFLLILLVLLLLAAYPDSLRFYLSQDFTGLFSAVAVAPQFWTWGSLTGVAFWFRILTIALFALSIYLLRQIFRCVFHSNLSWRIVVRAKRLISE